MAYGSRPRDFCLACNLKMQQAQAFNNAASSSSGHAPRLVAVAASLASEVSGFVVELVAKRPRIEPERLDNSSRGCRDRGRGESGPNDAK